MKHFTFPLLFYKVLNKPVSPEAPGRVAERRANVRGFQTELLDTFLKLGYLSPEALANLKAGGSRPGVPGGGKAPPRGRRPVPTRGVLPDRGDDGTAREARRLPGSQDRAHSRTLLPRGPSPFLRGYRRRRDRAGGGGGVAFFGAGGGAGGGNFPPSPSGGGS